MDLSEYLVTWMHIIIRKIQYIQGFTYWRVPQQIIGLNLLKILKNGGGTILKTFLHSINIIKTYSVYKLKPRCAATITYCKYHMVQQNAHMEGRADSFRPPASLHIHWTQIYATSHPQSSQITVSVCTYLGQQYIIISGHTETGIWDPLT